VTSEEKAIAALKELVKKDVAITLASHLRDDLGLDSGNLIELTVLVHQMYGIDLGRNAAQRKMIPLTVADVASLLEPSP
jgi:acyl carrier protein